MERKPYSLSELEKYKGKKVSKEILLGRNYFYCLDGKVTECNDSYTMPDLDDRTKNDFGDTIPNIRKTMAKQLRMEYIGKHWVKCMPVNPEDCECEAYIVLCISVNEKFVIDKISVFVWMYEYLDSIMGLTPEIVDELNSLCKGKFLPNEFSFIGKKVSKKLKAIFHLHNSGCDYSLHCMSGYRDVTTSFFINVDDKDQIKDISISTNMNERMIMKPVSEDDEYEDVMDGLLLMYDKL